MPVGENKIFNERDYEIMFSSKRLFLNFRLIRRTLFQGMESL